MTFWWAWAGAILTAVLIGTSVRGKFCAVGADWLQTQGGWVRHYELTKATAEAREGDVQLELEDHDERVIRPWLSAFHRDHDVWDYVHNGLTHSIIGGGAETNTMLHSALDLPKPWPQDRRT